MDPEDVGACHWAGVVAVGLLRAKKNVPTIGSMDDAESSKLFQRRNISKRFSFHEYCRVDILLQN